MFTFATTRNIHLELTPSIDTTLIRAIIRFRSRRGDVRLFISDNFQTFKSSDLELYLTLHKIKWKFILAASPWWGGFERMVKVVKTSLHKVIGKSKLSHEKLETVLIQIENTIQRLIQKLIPLEITKRINTEILPNVNNNFNENSLNESLLNANEHKDVQRPKRTAVANANAKIKLINEDGHEYML